MEIDIHQGDALAVLRTLPENSVHCCVTSPPYWNYRNYGVAGQIGMEPSMEEYIQNLVAVFNEVKRVLRNDGTCWIVIGDSYAGGGRGSMTPKQQTNRGSRTQPASIIPQGLKAKDLCGIPWRLAFALQAEGWYWRSEIIWHKTNSMTENVTDRPTRAHEIILLLSKSARVFYDYVAIASPSGGHHNSSFTDERDFKTKHRLGKGQRDELNIANKRDVWIVPHGSSSVPHYASFPPALIEPCIMAGTSLKGCCLKCGAQWKRIVEKVRKPRGDAFGRKEVGDKDHGQAGSKYQEIVELRTVGWKPDCDCHGPHPAAEDPPPYGSTPCTVLDPFLGSGTTAVVAAKLGRACIGIELSPEYVKLAKKRIRNEVGLLIGEGGCK